MALMGSPMMRDHAPTLNELGVRQAFYDEWELCDNLLEEVYTVVPSRKRTEKDVMLSGLGTYQPKAEGDVPDYDNGQEAWTVTYTHQTWALAIEMTEEAIEDDLYDYFVSLGKELGRTGAYTQQVEAMDIFNNLSATIYVAEGTSYPLLSTGHYRVDGGTWANRPSVALDLGLESYETMLTLWRTNLKDLRGRIICSVQPRILMVGPSDEWIAARILESDKRPFGADNDTNVVRERRRVRLLVNEFMTDDGRWFLLAEKRQTGLRYNVRARRVMRRRDEPLSGNLVMVGRYRESHGASHPFGVFGTP